MLEFNRVQAANYDLKTTSLDKLRKKFEELGVHIGHFDLENGLAESYNQTLADLLASYQDEPEKSDLGNLAKKVAKVRKKAAKKAKAKARKKSAEGDSSKDGTKAGNK